MGGADCSRPLFSVCAASIGLKEPSAAPCVIDHTGSNAPVSCECLMECEALGLMGVRECYIMDKGNSSVMSWVRTQRGQRGLDANEQYWESNLKGTEAKSVEKCKGRGVWAPAKPPSAAGTMRFGAAVREQADGDGRGGVRGEVAGRGAVTRVIIFIRLDGPCREASIRRV